MMKHQWENIPMKTIQKRQIQTKLLPTPTLCQNNTKCCNHRRYIFVKFKAKESLQCGSYMEQRFYKI